MKKYWPKVYFVVLLLLAGIAVAARFYKLGSMPVGIHADEASYGYDAYSILKTGKDIWGVRMPLAFKAFGEYKLNLPYLIAPAIKLVGLNTTATRLPSAIFGLATGFMLFATLSLLRKDKLLNLLLTIIFLVSPWTFGISRVFFESNVALFFVSVGIYTFIRVLSKKKVDKLYYLGIAALSIAGYFYAPMRFIGLAILVLGLYFSRKEILKTIAVYLLVTLPILPQYFSAVGLNRLRQESAMRDFENSLVINENRALCSNKICYLFWNKPLMRLESFGTTIVKQVGVDYLFFDSADNYIVPPSTGVYLYYLAPFFFLGTVFLFKDKKWFILLATLVSLLVSSSASKITIYRNVAALYFVFIIIAYGLYAAKDYLKKSPKLWRNIFYLGFLAMALFLHTRYLVHYFRIYSKSSTFAWSADAEYIAKLVGRKRYEYRTIIDKSAGDFGPLYTAFYNADDPEILRARAEWTHGDPAGWTHIGKIGNVASADNRSIENLLCEKASAPQDNISILYITAPMPDYSKFVTEVTHDQRGEKVLHEIYDVDSLYKKIMDDNPVTIKRLCPRETSLW